MTTSTLQKKANKLEKITREARKALLEFQVAKSKWDIENKMYTVYPSTKALIKDVRQRIS